MPRPTDKDNKAGREKVDMGPGVEVTRQTADAIQEHLPAGTNLQRAVKKVKHAGYKPAQDEKGYKSGV